MPLHHYLPASFIARFSSDLRKVPARDKRVQVGDKRNQTQFSSSAEKVGCINNLYTLAHSHIEPEEVDQTWTEYERGLPNAIDSLINNTVDATTWTRVLVPFVACMLVRGPDFEDRFFDRFPPGHRQELSYLFTSDQANAARLREIPRLLTGVLAAKWIVLSAHGKEKLLTNDLGYSPYINPTTGDQGLAIPLSQKKILAIVPGKEDRIILRAEGDKWMPNISYMDLPPGNHEGLNLSLAHIALRFIFGPEITLVQKYYRGVAESFTAPEPIELGFPRELLSPAFEFTWHRLVSAIIRPPSATDGWDFSLDWKIVTSGWHSMPFLPVNLIEFPPALKRVENTIQLKFYDPTVYFDISQMVMAEKTGDFETAIKIATEALIREAPQSLKAELLAKRAMLYREQGKIAQILQRVMGLVRKTVFRFLQKIKYRQSD
jgi:hypothetical protein